MHAAPGLERMYTSRTPFAPCVFPWKALALFGFGLVSSSRRSSPSCPAGWLALAGVPGRSRRRDAARDRRRALLHEASREDAARGRRWDREPHRSRLQRQHRRHGSAGVDVAGRRLQPPRKQMLREERQSLYQRELLLDTVIQATPLAMVLTNANGRVVYSNVAARQTFLGGRKLEGLAFAELIAASPSRCGLAVGAGGRLAVHDRRAGRAGDLPILNQLPAQQPGAPPVPAQANDARAGAPGSRDVEEGHPRDRARAQQFARADLVAGALRRQTVQRPDRRAAGADLSHDRGARAASAYVHRRLRALRQAAAPAAEPIDWPAFLRSLQETAPFTLAGESPTRPGVFDPAQIEQVIINLVKNAKAAGGNAAGQHRAARP